jgi:hypothetical protein
MWKNRDWVLPFVFGGLAMAMAIASLEIGSRLWRGSAAPTSAAGSVSAGTELEQTPDPATGQTPAVTAQLLSGCDGTLWRNVWPEGRIAVCRLAAQRLHPEQSEEFQWAMARHYFNFVEECVYAGKKPETKISEYILVAEGIHRTLNKKTQRAARQDLEKQQKRQP